MENRAGSYLHDGPADLTTENGPTWDRVLVTDRINMVKSHYTRPHFLYLLDYLTLTSTFGEIVKK